MRIALVFAVLLSISGVDVAAHDDNQPVNVIYFIADGFGPASLTLARISSDGELALDRILTGSVGTGATNSHVTDSAAAGTALACGIKTANGRIGMTADEQPVGCLLEAAQGRGMNVGVVTTTRLTHATPASFFARVPLRSMEDVIGEQMLDSNVDLLLGGGRSYLLGGSEGRRPDDRNLIREFVDAGYGLVEDRESLSNVSSLPLLGVFASGEMSYEIDRHTTDQPSLAEMTDKAIEQLSTSDSGFFLMIEAGRIDHAAHGNDAAAHLYDILAYDEAVRVALEFAERDGRTLIVTTADHETGGMTIGRDNRYEAFPEILKSTTMSSGRMSEYARERAGDDPLTVDLLAEIISEVSPITELTEQDVEDLESAAISESSYQPGRTMAIIIGRHALIGWTTGGHTAVDVTLHAFGPGSDRFTGHIPNHEVALRIAEVLDLDLDAVTLRWQEDQWIIDNGQ